MLDDLMLDPNQWQPGGIQTDPTKPKRPSFLDAFQGGMQQRQYGQSPLLAGLAGQQGRGGILGGIGRIAHFLL